MTYCGAVQHLRRIAGACEAHLAWPTDAIIVGAYACGELLEGPEELDMIEVALAVALPPAHMYGNVMPEPVWDFMKRTRLHRLPVHWYCRPSALPIADHRIHQPVRIWSTDRPLPHIIELIANRRFADLQIEPVMAPLAP